MFRKRHTAATLLLLLTLLLSACAPAAPTIPSTADAPQASAETPVSGRGQGGTLRLIWWQAPTILNPHLASGGKDADASRVVYEPLASVNRDGVLTPILAAEIPTVENGGLAADGTSVTWTLKEGVTWSDGVPFTAEDVKFTYTYVANAETAATTGSTYTAIDNVEVIDPATVQITFKQPNPAWALPFVGVNGLIIPKHIFEEYVGAKSKEAPANLLPVGTGAFQVVEFKPGDIVVYAANPNFREADKPFFSRVELKGGGDAASAARAVLQTGDTDFAWNLQVEASVLEELAKGGKGITVPNPGGLVERLELNFSDPNTEVDGERASITVPHPFFSDLRVRQAVALAIDRETIANQLYGPAGVATSNLLVAPPNFASPNTRFIFDLEQAAALLDEAGWIDSDGDQIRDKDGINLQVVFQTSANPLRQKTQEIIKQALESIGFGVELKAIDSTVFFNNDPANPDTLRHFYADIQMYTSGNSSADPGDFLEDFTCAEIAQKSNDWSKGNPTRWCNPEYDALVVQAKTELDPAKREALFIQLNDLLINDVVVIPVVHRRFPNGASVTLDGIELTPWDSSLWQIKDWVRKAQ